MSVRTLSKARGAMLAVAGLSMITIGMAAADDASAMRGRGGDLGGSKSTERKVEAQREDGVRLVADPARGTVTRHDVDGTETLVAGRAARGVHQMPDGTFLIDGTRPPHRVEADPITPEVVASGVYQMSDGTFIIDGSRPPHVVPANATAVPLEVSRADGVRFVAQGGTVTRIDPDGTETLVCSAVNNNNNNVD